MYVLAIDDANLHLQLRRDREMSVLDDIICNVRKGQIHIIACTQSPAELSSGILSNSSNKIVFRLSSGKDIEAMQRNMGVTDKEQKEYFYKLNQNEHEVIIEFTKRARPFVARIIKVELPKPMSKEEIMENNERIMQGFSTPVFRKKPDENQTEQESEPSVDEKLLLHASFLELTQPLAGLQKKLGWSAERIVKVCKSIQEKRLCRVESFNFSGKRGGMGKHIVLTDRCLKLLNLPLYIKKARGGTDTTHTYLQRIISDSLKDKGYETETEVNV